MKTLYLHIGTPKTGTSSIQSFLASNRKSLEQKSFCYPKTIRKYPGVFRNRNGHYMVPYFFNEDGSHNTELEKSNLEEGLLQLREIFESFDNVILSEENIWRRSQKTHKWLFPRLKEEAALQGFCVKIIVYLRRQDQFLLSRWNQSIKYTSSSTETWEKYKKKILKTEGFTLDYAGTLERISEIFGKENIIVRRFARDHWTNGSLIDDFLSCIGLSADNSFVMSEPSVNPGLYGNTMEIKRIINTDNTLSMDERSYLGSFLKELSPESAIRYPNCMMSQSEIKDFLAKYEEGNARVAAEYIGDDLPLFSNEIEELPKWTVDNPYMTEDVIRFFSALAIDLRRENQSLREELTMLKAFRQKVKHPIHALLNRPK